MSELVPGGWKKLRLKNVSVQMKGLTYKSEDYTDESNGLPFLTLKSVSKSGGYSPEGLKFYGGDFKEHHILSVGDILFANTDLTRDGDVVGSPLYFEGFADKSLYSMDLSRLITDPDKADSKFLYYLIMTHRIKRFMVNFSAGSTVLHLDTKRVQELFVTLPPLSEQKKIASILTSVDEVIEKTQKHIEKLRDLKKAVMNELLTKGIGHTEFKDSKLGRIPKSWLAKNMGSISQFSGGSAFKEIYQGKTQGVYPFAKVSDMNLAGNEKFLYKSNNWISNEVRKEAKIKIFPAQSTVFAKVGAALLLNNRRQLIRETAIDNNMMAAIPSHCNHDFLFYLLQTIDLKTIVQSGAVPSVNQKQMKSIPVSVPPLHEQKKIASILTSIDKNIEEKQRKLQKTKSLKKSLMQDLLTGKVRVKVN
ncbi:MAG: restriction endonuclease subunit S [Candidatus Dadabacteria bacterium]|nr:restriction endonuclease subunit S [Candidatus Dadabacteria bacterium]